MRPLLFIALAAFIAGCAPDLKPAPSAQAVPGLEEAARSTVKGVSMVAQADEWPGEFQIREEVTPIRVIIENNSGEPLRIAYDLFALVGPGGERYSALPPLQIEGTVERPTLAPGYGPIGAPGFGYSRFAVAPYYGPLYPGISPYTGPFGYDPFYYDRYYRRWIEIELPTEDMINRALPEGVLSSGGRVDGFLYFEKISDDLPRVIFRADLVNAENNNNFGEIRIPFVLD